MNTWRRNPTQFGLVGVIATALLALSSACRPPATTGGDTPFLERNGPKGPPGKDTATQRYVKDKIHFYEILNGHVDVRFKTGAQQKEVILKVEPENSADKVDWYSAANDEFTGGSIVARFENKDEVDVPELGLHHKHDKSYLWVGPLTADYSKKGVAFYTFDKDGVLLEGPLYIIDKVVRCKDSYGHRPSVRVHINHPDEKCTPPTSLGALTPAWRVQPQLTAYRKNTVSLKEALAYGGLWISCSGGCCDVGGGAFY